MSATISTRWYFSDWTSDPNVRACSLAARGLWMDMLCIAGANKGRDYGFVMVAGRGLGAKEIGRQVGASESEVAALLDELESNGVFSKDRRGVIYCRRMVRAEKNRGNGRLGGNPNLLKKKENQNSLQPNPKAHIPEPEPEPEVKKDSPPAGRRGQAALDLGPGGDWPKDYQAQFWAAYPRKTEKKAALAKLDAIRKSGVRFLDLMAGVERLNEKVRRERTPEKYIKHPTTWLNRGCWEDQYNQGDQNEEARRPREDNIFTLAAGFKARGTRATA